MQGRCSFEPDWSTAREAVCSQVILQTRAAKSKTKQVPRRQEGLIFKNINMGFIQKQVTEEKWKSSEEDVK